MQPLGLDDRAEPDLDAARPGTALSLLDVHGHHPLTRGLEPEHRRAAGGKDHAAPIVRPAARHAIGEGREHRQPHGPRPVVGGRARAAAPGQTGRQLAPDAADLLDGAAIELQPAQGLGTKAGLLGLPVQIDEIDHLRAPVRRAAARAPARALERRTGVDADVPFGDERGGETTGRAGAPLVRLDHQAGEPRVNGETGHATADRR